MPSKILLVGYGNVDRQDDGVAWHVLKTVAQKLGLPSPDTPGDGFYEVELSPSTDLDSGDMKTLVDIWFEPQLTPEMAETIGAYQSVCFVDAHTGSVPEEISFRLISSSYQASPFTHHLTPQTCLELCKVIYGQTPEGHLMSVRGYVFGFASTLSERTNELAQDAARRLVIWLGEKVD